MFLFSTTTPVSTSSTTTKRKLDDPSKRKSFIQTPNHSFAHTNNKKILDSTSKNSTNGGAGYNSEKSKTSNSNRRRVSTSIGKVQNETPTRTKYLDKQKISASNQSSSSLDYDEPTIANTNLQSNTGGGEPLLSLLKVVGTAIKHLSSYRCKDAIDTFKLLPEKHYDTAWVYCNIGRYLYQYLQT
jgi:hypothetical protein